MTTLSFRRTIRTAWLYYCAIILFAFVAGCTTSPSGSDDTGDVEPVPTTTVVEVQLSGIATRSRSNSVWALNPDFAVNAHTMNLIITAPDFAERREEMPLETGQGVFTVTVGDDRTFKIEVHNPSGVLVYESAPRTLDLVAGTPLSIDMVVDPVELRLPLVSVSQLDPGQELTVEIADPDSPLQGLRVTVPANATDQAMTVSVTEVYNPTDIALPELQAGVIVELLPNGVTFAPPVTVEFPYNDPLLHVLGMDEATLRINRFEPSMGEWVPVPNQSVDTERNLIVAQLTHFSFYVITYDPTGAPTPEPTPPPNQAPVVVNPGAQTTVEQATVSVAIQATDADGDALTYSATGLPAGLSIDASTGQISGTIASSAASSRPYTVTITIADGTHSTTATFPWVVSASTPPPPTNQPPVLSPIAAQSDVEGSTVSLVPQASDADGDTLLFSASGLPMGTTFNTATGQIAGTLGNTAGVGSPYTVTIFVSDGTDAVQTSFTWTITNPDPVVTWPGNPQHADGDAVSLQVNASDADNDALTYAALDLPSGLSMNQTGLISGVLSNAASTNSPYLVRVTVSDGAAESTTSFTWTVTNPHPGITSPGNQVHTEGDTVSVQVNATDADDDTLTYAASTLPPGLSMDTQTGLISGELSTSASTNSPYQVTVTVSDGEAESSTTFTWQVDPANPPTLLVTWTAPTTNVDDTPLTDLASYRLYYGRTSRGTAITSSEFTYENSVNINDAQATSFSLPTPPPRDTYYFSLTAIDTSGNESDFSEERSLDIS